MTETKTISALSTAARQKIYAFINAWSLDEISLSDIDAMPLDVEVNIQTTNWNVVCATRLLHAAVLADDTALLRELCEQGAWVSQTDARHDDKTALALAVDYGRASCARILVQHQANVAALKAVSYCEQPLTFLWACKEQMVHGREADYSAVQAVLQDSASKLKVS